MSSDQNNSLISIPELFEDKSVFITGGSGFIGKVLIEKLLRTCPGVKNVYVLVRPKKNKNILERIEDLIDVPLFDLLKRDNPDVLKKILGVAGDITQLNLGLTDEDTTTLIDKVSIIYHVAASVRFNDNLKKAILTNTRSTREIITLAKKCKILDVFVYCSTGYCNFDQEVIEEIIYPPKQDWRTAIEMAETYDEMTLQVLTEKCIHPLPNTYTYTKGLAEQLVIDMCTNQIPAIIMRPSIVLPSFSDPVVGWIDNYNGPMSLFLLEAKGILKVLYCEKETEVDNVFVDNTAKVLLIAPWKKITQSDSSIVDIYNIASDMNYTGKFIYDVGHKILLNDPPESFITTADTILIEDPFVFYVLTIIFHLLPAIILDSISRLTGNKSQLIRIIRLLYTSSVALGPFAKKSVKFRTENYAGLEDSLLECDKKALSFQNFRVPVDSPGVTKALYHIWRGMKQYLLKEKPYTTAAELNRYKRLIVVEKTIYFIIRCSIFYFFIMKIVLPLVTSQYERITSP